MSTLKVNTIEEATGSSGITLDNEVKVDTVNEKTAANGVAVDGVTCKDGGITLNGGATALNHYEESTSFTTTWQFDGTSPGAASAAKTIKLVRVGKHVTATIEVAEAVTGSSGTLVFASQTAIPANFRPTTSFQGTVVNIVEDGTGTPSFETAFLKIDADGIFKVFQRGHGYSGSIFWPFSKTCGLWSLDDKTICFTYNLF